MAQLIGSILHNRYRIQSLLGHQTGRRTCLATDLKTGASVVIKLLLFGPDFTWDDLKLFEREAAVLQSLDHPAIPKYLDSFEVETEFGKGFALVQSYIKAKSLQQWLQSGRTFSQSELQAIATSLLKTLDYLHQRHPAIVHRDVKPSNILLGSSSWCRQFGQVYLVDFGSVQTAASSGTRTVVGTYGYMPLEQFGGQTLPASDLYALGATLIYLATGQHPDQLPQHDMRLLFENRVTLSEHWIDWLKWLTEPSLDRRAPSTKQALEALEQFSKFPSSASFEPSQPPVGKEPDVLERPKQPILIVSGGSDQSLVTQSDTKNGMHTVSSVFGMLFRGVLIYGISTPIMFLVIISCTAVPYIAIQQTFFKGVDDYLANGDSFYQEQNYDSAINSYSEALKLDSNNAVAYVKRGDTYESKKDYDHAIADFNQALKLDPKNVDAFVSRGDAFENEKDYDRAIAEYNQALKLNPKNVRAYNNRGIAFYYKQDYDRAMTDYNQALRLDPKTAYVYCNRGLVYEAKNSHEAAMADFDQTLKLDPNYVDAYVWRGMIFYNRKDYDRAIANYNQALRLDSRNVYAYLDRGQTHFNQGNTAAAILDFDQALEIDPDIAVDAHYFRGLAYKDKGRKNEALEDLEKYVRLTKNAELKQKAQKEISLLRSIR